MSNNRYKSIFFSPPKRLVPGSALGMWRRVVRPREFEPRFGHEYWFCCYANQPGGCSLNKREKDRILVAQEAHLAFWSFVLSCIPVLFHCRAFCTPLQKARKRVVSSTPWWACWTSVPRFVQPLGGVNETLAGLPRAIFDLRYSHNFLNFFKHVYQVTGVLLRPSTIMDSPLHIHSIGNIIVQPIYIGTGLLPFVADCLATFHVETCFSKKAGIRTVACLVHKYSDGRQREWLDSQFEVLQNQAQSPSGVEVWINRYQNEFAGCESGIREDGKIRRAVEEYVTVSGNLRCIGNFTEQFSDEMLDLIAIEHLQFKPIELLGRRNKIEILSTNMIDKVVFDWKIEEGLTFGACIGFDRVEKRSLVYNSFFIPLAKRCQVASLRTQGHCLSKAHLSIKIKQQRRIIHRCRRNVGQTPRHCGFSNSTLEVDRSDRSRFHAKNFIGPLLDKREQNLKKP